MAASAPVPNPLNEDPHGRATVVHVITGLDVAGSELVLAQLVSGARRHRHVVVSLGSEGQIGARLRDKGIPVHALGLRFSNPLPGFLRLLKILRAERARIVQGWLAHGNFAAALAQRLLGPDVRLLWTIRQSLSDLALEKRTTRAIIRLNARLSRRPTRIIYNSHLSACQHEAIGYAPERRLVVANGFDLERFRPSDPRRETMRRTLGFSNEEVVVGLIGRFHATKNHRTFFAAAARVLAAEPNARFLLAGTGVTTDNPALLAEVEDTAILECSRLLGTRDDVEALNNALDIACNVSIGESFSNAVGEAMASGVPCVVTETGDALQLVGDTGIVCTARDDRTIADAICRLIAQGEEPRRRLGARARSRMERNYSLEAMVAHYEDLYDATLGTPFRVAYNMVLPATGRR